MALKVRFCYYSNYFIETRQYRSPCNISIIVGVVKAECLTKCINHSLSETNCTVSSTDTDNITTAISSDILIISESDITTTHDQENNIIVASTTVLEDSTNLRPLIFTTTSAVEKTTAFQHCTCKMGRSHHYP